jgi:glutamate racemase
MPTSPQPIGVFDSGYGGLTVLKEMVARLPQYDYLYLGDNARAPYGTRSFETVYHYTLQCVQWFFQAGCPLVILACNTASAKALRTIQQVDLPRIAPDNRVLGVIRPTTEVVGNFTRTGKVGILATRGTVLSESYPIEIGKFFPSIEVYQQACPLWVPLIENNEHDKPGADYFVKEYIKSLFAQNPGGIDTVLLACTHYPLLGPKIEQCLPPGCKLVSQGEIVATALADYLQRHPEMEERCSKGGQLRFFTTDSTEDFDDHASIFYGKPLKSEHVPLP